MKIKKILIGGLTVAYASAMLLSFSACGDSSSSGEVKAPGVSLSSNTTESSNNNSNNGSNTPTAAPKTEAPDGGFVTDENGNKRYYVDGEAQTGIVGNENEGFYYANSDGLVDTGYCDGVSVDGEDWCVIEGKATKAVSDEDKALFAACQAVGKCTNSGMSREEKLRAAFDYIKTAYLEGVRHDPPYNEMDWPVVCANDLFIYGMGDCFSYGAAFAFYGKAIGFEECYACNSGGHGWAEIDGKFYDPEWDMHHQEYNHFGVGPDDPNDVDYSGGIAPGAPWMHVKV